MDQAIDAAIESLPLATMDTFSAKKAALKQERAEARMKMQALTKDYVGAS